MVAVPLKEAVCAPNHWAMSATPSNVIVCAGFVPATAVLESSPSDRIRPVNVGGVPVSSTFRSTLPGSCTPPCRSPYAVRPNVCGPAVVLTVNVQVARRGPLTQSPGGTVVAPDFAYSVVNAGPGVRNKLPT